MVAHGLVQGYLNDCREEWCGFEMGEAEEALVIGISIALGHAHSLRKATP
jgi:hypothetical protein